ncbi:hypothetical protein EDD11_008506 [Mortierella claussenii]|nr:hypothetical protein EDD11_008506 [Mortierella claussenii]
MLTTIDKQAFQAGIEDQGFRVRMCQTEADLCIARHARTAAAEDFFAVSSNSDLLVHTYISKILKLISRGSEFALYTKAEFGQSLSPPSIDHLTLLGPGPDQGAVEFQRVMVQSCARRDARVQSISGGLGPKPPQLLCGHELKTKPVSASVCFQGHHPNGTDD